MPDLQDWHKRVELEAKAVQRTLGRIRHSSGAKVADTNGHALETPEDLLGDAADTDEFEQVFLSKSITEPDIIGADQLPVPTLANEQSVLPPNDAPSRRGRGARRSETREELLNRLLDPTLTLEETARMLEVCPTTVRRYTNRGILPHERSKGNQRRFKLSSVLAFMESQAKVGPQFDTE